MGRLAASFGLDLGKLDDVEPLQVESSSNSKTAQKAAKEMAKQQAHAAEKAGARGLTQRILALATNQARIRIEAGESVDEIEREDAALREAEREGVVRRNHVGWRCFPRTPFRIAF